MILSKTHLKDYERLAIGNKSYGETRRKDARPEEKPSADLSSGTARLFSDRCKDGFPGWEAGDLLLLVDDGGQAGEVAVLEAEGEGESDA